MSAIKRRKTVQRKYWRKWKNDLTLTINLLFEKKDRITHSQNGELEYLRTNFTELGDPTGPMLNELKATEVFLDWGAVREKWRYDKIIFITRRKKL